MDCHFLCFYGTELNFKILSQFLKGLNTPYRIVSNSSNLKNMLENVCDEFLLLGDIFPQEGKIAEEVYSESRSLLERYREIFRDIIYHDIEVFRGFEFQLLIHLTAFIKAKKILETKKNTLFVFEKFSPIYFAIMRLAQELGYNNKVKVGFVKKQSIDYLEAGNYQGFSNYANETSKTKSIHFIKNAFGKRISPEKIKALWKFVIGVSSLKIKQFAYKKMLHENSDIVNYILKKIDGKIKNNPPGFNALCAILVTAARLDLYFRPLVPILEEFKKRKVPIQVFTSDMATSLTLTKENVKFFNLFEEVNLLLDFIANTKEGQKIKQKIQNDSIQKKSIIGFKELLPDILRKTFRTMAIIIILDHMFSKMKLKAIIDAGSGEMLENVAIEIAKKHKISNFTIVPSPPKTYPLFSSWFHANNLFLEGEQGKEVLKKLGYDEKKFIMVGSSRYDHCIHLKSSESKNRLHDKYGIKLTKTLIVIAMSRWHEFDEKWLSEFIIFCNRNNYEIIIKIHPTYKLRSISESKKRINYIEEKCRNLKFLISYDFNVTLFLSAADIVITDWSSVGLEAILLDKPLIQANFGKKKIDKYVRYYDYGASLYFENYDLFEKSISSIIKEKKYLEELKIGRQKIIKKYIFRNDGKASERIFEKLIM